MNNAFGIARVLAGVMMFPLLLGFVWFLGTFDVTVGLYAVAMLTAFAIAAALPRKFYRLPWLRASAISLYVGAICLTLPIMYRDLTLINYPDFPAFSLRGIQVIVLVLMIVEAVGSKSEQVD